MLTKQEIAEEILKVAERLHDNYLKHNPMEARPRKIVREELATWIDNYTRKCVRGMVKKIKTKIKNADRIYYYDKSSVIFICDTILNQLKEGK